MIESYWIPKIDKNFKNIEITDKIDIKKLTEGIIIYELRNDDLGNPNNTPFPRSLKIFKKYRFDKNGNYTNIGNVIVPKENNGVRVCRIFYNYLHDTLDEYYELAYKPAITKVIKYAKKNNLTIYAEDCFACHLEMGNRFESFLINQCEKEDVKLVIIASPKSKENKSSGYDKSMGQELAENWSVWEYEYSFH